MKFTVGQRVVFLHEQGGGVVQAIEKGRYLVDCEDGFPRKYIENELASVHGDDYNINDDDIAILREESSQISVPHITRIDKNSKTGADLWEIDLHIEEIVDTHAGLTNTEILQRQMSAFRIFFNKARSKNIRKVVVIHGVGEGVLKYEVREFLNGFDGVEYYDADFREYGKGATAVEVRYNIR